MLHSKLCSRDTDLASPVATLEAFWGGWWPLSELLEIRAFCRAPIGSVVTGLVVAPGFSVKFTAMDVLFSYVIPPYPPPHPTLQSCLPFSIANPHPSVHSCTQQLWISSVPNTGPDAINSGEQSRVPALKELTVRQGRRTSKQLSPVW